MPNPKLKMDLASLALMQTHGLNLIVSVAPFVPTTPREVASHAGTDWFMVEVTPDTFMALQVAASAGDGPVETIRRIADERRLALS